MIPRISRNAVKEGFDTLPAAICYFDRNGLLRLINHRMQEIAAVLCGRDLQTLTDLEQALRSPGGGVRLRDEAARIYEFPDGTVYHFTVRPVQDKYGIPYTEVMATDVTQLAALHAALQQENERLADANRRAKRLYDNMPDIVRHAGATELYADSEHRPQAWHLCITNNGTPPRAEIKEGGGLSSLRRRIEKAGGTVTVHSLPVFVLEVTLPDKESTYDTRYDR